MAQGDTTITIVGNLVADPDLRFTPSGAAVANFRVASTPRTFNRTTNQWEDGDGLFLACNAWREMAENVAESLTKGMRVIVHGRLRQRSYETREGDKRTIFEIEVDEVGPSLKYAKAEVTRNARSNNNQGNTFSNHGGGQAHQSQPNTGGFSSQQPQGGFNNNPPGATTPGPPGQSGATPNPDYDPWNSSPAAGGGAGSDEPPF